MAHHLCPVCRSYGISARDKLLVRFAGHVLTCHACGTQMTVDYWRSLVSLVPLLASLGVGFLVNSAWGLIVCLLLGLAGSWLYSIIYVPLVPIGRDSHRR